MSLNECNVGHWDLLYAALQKDLKRKEDLLITLTHLVLINLGYSCIGLGNSKKLKGDERPSELLPPKWNESEEYYSIRYFKDFKVFLLHAFNVDDDLVINFLASVDDKINSIVINVNDAVVKFNGDSLAEIIPKYSEIVQTMRNELIGIHEAHTQTQFAMNNQKEKCVGSMLTNTFSGGRLPEGGPGLRSQPLMTSQRNLMDPFSYGKSDMGPLTSGSHGMLFNPLHAQSNMGFSESMTRNGVPPGARFDSIIVDGQRQNLFNPNPDGMQPPGSDNI